MGKDLLLTVEGAEALEGLALQYGMVGGGQGAFIGDSHRKAINLDGQAILTAGCFSRDYENCLKTGKQLRVDAERCYKTYQEMAEKEGAREDGIDYVVIVTPNDSHFPIAKAFLEAGIHVACDKPLCLTPEEADELVKLANDKGLLFMVTYTYIGHVTAKFARELVKQGELGRIRTVMGEYPQAWLAYEGEWGGKQGAWRTDPAHSGGTNCLGDLGTHIENTVAAITGLKVKRVLAKMEVVVPGRVLDDNDFVMVEYDNGASGLYWTSQIAIGGDNPLRIRIYGENGSIEWFQEDPDKIRLIKRDGTIVEQHRGYGSILPRAAKYGRLPSGHVEGWFEALANIYRSFHECLFAKKLGMFEPDMIDFPTVEEGAEGIHFLHACIESQKKGNVWVDVK